MSNEFYVPEVGDVVRRKNWPSKRLKATVTAVSRSKVIFYYDDPEMEGILPLDDLWEKVESSQEPLFNGVVFDAGGGVVKIYVDRDTDNYPGIGAIVSVYAKPGRL